MLISVENTGNLDLSEYDGDIFVYDFKPEQIAELDKLNGLKVEGANPNYKLWQLVKYRIEINN